MSELLPVSQAESLRASLLEYLKTTFALADNDMQAALEEFLQSPDHGLFRGPYVRLRLPFRPAQDGWRDTLDWDGGFQPYGHQAAAFARLSSAGLDAQRSRPLPTLVTTGTGSGKTEAFLYPILDHVLRAQRAGVAGTKAIVLYPMNALANDQAQRLARMITGNPDLGGITAALFTGQDGPQRSKVMPDSLITSRDVIRDTAPDILLTNYKMLDQMLLREPDANIWAQSAHSLQYLVLDEFHTYDGAQGTDVSMLLRRLGLTLKSHWTEDDARLTPEDWQRPLGRITPVATSATLGDKGDASAMLTFARTVFGENFPDEAVVTESRLSLEEWVGDAADVVGRRGWAPLDLDAQALADLTTALEDGGERAPDAATRGVFSHLYRVVPEDAGDGGLAVGHGWARPALDDADDELLLALAKAHPLVQRLVRETGDAIDLTDLVPAVLPEVRDPWHTTGDPVLVLTAVLGALSHLRAVQSIDRRGLSVDVHLWVRELTRVDRAATDTARLSWSDDGMLVDAGEPGATSTAGQVFPAIYCRHCGRSGWGVVLAPTGTDLDPTDVTIRQRHARRDDRFRPLVHATAEDEKARAGEKVDGLWWFVVSERRLVATRPEEADLGDDTVLPVLTHHGEGAGEASVDDTCPSCAQKDGIRFLGSAIATLLSVTLSGLFGTSGLDTAEKKALVFTDSVQDAAHRAGFVQARSHSLTLRAVLRQAIGDEPTDLEALTRAVIDLAGDDKNARYRLLPPAYAERDKFAPFWQAETMPSPSDKARKRVTTRLLLDVLLELGLRSAVGRTLEATGSVVAEVQVDEAVMAASAQGALADATVQGSLDTFTPDHRDLVAWVRGVVERLRTRGAIQHEWFDRFRREDGNRWWITGGRPRHEGMPGFGRGNSAPAFPRIGGSGAVKDSDLEPVGAAQGWYAGWTAKCLGVPKTDGAVLARLLFQHLERRGVVGAQTSTSGAQTFHLQPRDVVVQAARLDDLEAGRLALECTVCRTVTHGTERVVNQLDDAGCLVARCSGKQRRYQVRDNFYRDMYASHDVRRVVAREHTSLLDDKVRLEYENQFKSTTPAPNAPNVLVATPTLEMGIDIGDLSTVMLASLPRSVASYLQRIGRAGRLTGNALALAFVTGRGDQLPRFAEPLTVINGEVRPPATYLDAEEILQRQYLASVADALARRKDAPHPKTAKDALGSTGEGTYLGTLVDEAEVHATAYLDRFLAGFDNLNPDVVARLRAWAVRDGDVPGTSGLGVRCHAASHAWTTRVEALQFREQEIQKSLVELDQRAESPAATDSDKVDRRTAHAALRLTRDQFASLRSEYWVSVLEEFGLFPNYTLLDDSVSLEVAVSWMDPDTQTYQYEPLVLERGSAQALKDFAPGATFYASGYAIEIDAIELGRDNAAVRTWACCPACGYVLDVGETGTTASVPACPRCDDQAIADVDQRLQVVELRSVSAAVRREEAAIDDRRDERVREGFTVLTLADVDPSHVTRQWYVDGYGFGAKHLRDLSIRWLNLGRSAGRGTTHEIAGSIVDAPLFRVCTSCGKLDTSTGANSSAEHRPWCPQRKATTEKTASIALARSLRTEGLVMRLPTAVTVGDGFSLPSLSAAVLLALRERLGGSPDHIEITSIVDPTRHDDGQNPSALLLHDKVPGGTGYLAELADEKAVWAMLRRAWEVLRDCPCQVDGKLACDRCLLPFAPAHLVSQTSRATGQRYLGEILRSGARTEPGEDEPTVPEEMAWTVTADEPPSPDPESQLEQKFRQVLRTRLEGMGATVKEVPTSVGSSWRITLGGGAQWRLDPQQFVLGAKPDFVLTAGRPGIPRVAIFTDGWRYHASPTHDRVADDAAKRRDLRDAGYLVVALTWADLDGAEKPSDLPVAVPWLVPGSPAEVLAQSHGAITPSTMDLVQRNPLELLLGWVQSPLPEAREALARWLPLLALGKSKGYLAPSGVPLAGLALAVLDGEAPPAGDTRTWFWHYGTLVLGIRLLDEKSLTTEVALVLDDADGSLGEQHRDAWREWLRLSNLLNLRVSPTVVTTRSLLVGDAPVPAVASPSGADVPVDGAEGDLPEGDWQHVYEEALGVEKVLVVALADLAERGLAAPSLGAELGDGITLSLAWEDRRVTILHEELTEEDRDDLLAHGWQLVEPDIDVLRAALTAERRA
ncbi:DEAD/DEAH box helicase [Oerskovia enterophila]|uniref:DEAD/DEAH box helicase n=1 Tax=Oerskovia enterophila TaxID=43678 RepID=UPI0037FE74B0